MLWVSFISLTVVLVTYKCEILVVVIPTQRLFFCGSDLTWRLHSTNEMDKLLQWLCHYDCHDTVERQTANSLLLTSCFVIFWHFSWRASLKDIVSSPLAVSWWMWSSGWLLVVGISALSPLSSLCALTQRCQMACKNGFHSPKGYLSVDPAQCR